MNGKTFFSNFGFPILSVLLTAVCTLLLINAYKSNDFYIKHQSASVEIETGDTETGIGEEPILTVNINTADISELSELPGIGNTLASRIVEYRSSRGAFKDIAEITAVNGIGDAIFEKIKAYITV